MKRFEVRVEVGPPPHSLVRMTEEELNAYDGPIHTLRVVSWPEIFTAHPLNDDERFSVKLVNAMGDDLEPLRSARMSTDNPTGVDRVKDDRLRDRLWAEKHTSPWESNILVVEMVVPMFVLRQIDRHRTMSVSEPTVEDYDDFRKFTSRNEYSARYSRMPDLYYVPPASRFQKKSLLNKQGSGDPLTENEQWTARAGVELSTDSARLAYDKLIEMGVSSELARIVLPFNQGTKIRLQASLLNWFKFLELRLAPAVQEETRAYAQAISTCIQQLWPRCYEAFEEHTLGAITLSRTEVRLLRDLLTRTRGTSEIDLPTYEALSKRVRDAWS
jgi:thymidylate synthase (FAD)